MRSFFQPNRLPERTRTFLSIETILDSVPTQYRHPHRDTYSKISACSYFPLNLAGRFSTYAANPSPASSLWKSSC